VVSYNSTVSIRRSAEQIFPYLLETTLNASGRDLSDGSTVHVSFNTGPIKAVIGLQVSAIDFGHRLAFKTYSGPINWEGEYNLAEDGKGSTTVSQKGSFRFKGVWRLWQPFAGGQIKRGEVQELQRLKTRMEAIPATA
jgi:hypothetical protein